MPDWPRSRKRWHWIPSSAEYRIAYVRALDREINASLGRAERALIEMRYGDAEAAYRRVLALQPSNDRALAGLRLIETARRHDTLYQEAEAAWAKRDVDGAQGRLRAILAANGNQGPHRALAGSAQQVFQRLKGFAGQHVKDRTLSFAPGDTSRLGRVRHLGSGFGSVACRSLSWSSPIADSCTSSSAWRRRWSSDQCLQRLWRCPEESDDRQPALRGCATGAASRRCSTRLSGFRLRLRDRCLQCLPRQWKGRAERGVGYVKHNFLQGREPEFAALNSRRRCGWRRWRACMSPSGRSVDRGTRLPAGGESASL
jgi:hypothetical protein